MKNFSFPLVKVEALKLLAKNKITKTELKLQLKKKF